MSWEKFLLLGPLTDRAIKKYALKGYYGAKIKAQYTANEEAQRRAKHLTIQRAKHKREKAQIRAKVKSLKQRLDEFEQSLL